MRRLSLNTHGGDVAAWQTFLIGQGFLEAGGADGQFGPKTEDATRRYQASHSLDADGIVGPKTFATAQVNNFVIPALPSMPDVLKEVHPELARLVAQLLEEAVARNFTMPTERLRSKPCCITRAEPHLATS